MRIKRVFLSRQLQELKALHLACFPSDSEPPWERSEWWIGYDDNGKAIAFAGGHVHEPDKWFYLSRAGILESHRGRHLQRRLVRVRVRRAAQLAAKGVYTFTVPSNYASSNTLIRCGFKLFRPARKWGGRDSLYWYKKLPS